MRPPSSSHSAESIPLYACTASDTRCNSPSGSTKPTVHFTDGSIPIHRWSIARYGEHPIILRPPIFFALFAECLCDARSLPDNLLIACPNITSADTCLDAPVLRIEPYSVSKKKNSRAKVDTFNGTIGEFVRMIINLQ